ncbi:MAG TPA: sigma-70 family RNA polymerase sigma factor [Candidatus Polarisedimenticolia bacterium]|nr:sigma-70 family RNA polymerase sigma factor [Candidatus Polarisedimenticolia bacterium]
MDLRPVEWTENEEELIRRAREGDPGAFDRIVQDHLSTIWRIVWRILRHREDTEDVVQEVFFAAYQALAGFRGECRLTTWLHRIAVTRSLNHLKSRGEKIRRASRPLEVATELSFETPDGAAARTPLVALEAKELASKLAQCLEMLPALWRSAVALRDGEEMSYEEMADVLGVPLGTVRSRLARARLALRDCIRGAGV